MMLFWILAVTTLLSAASVRRLAAKNRHRWPRLASATLARRGRYADLREDGMPASAQLSAVGAVVFGLITMAVFVPAGSFLAMFALDGGLPMIGFGTGLGVLCVSGAVLGFRYARAGRDAAVRDGEALDRLARHSLWHHLGVAALFFALAAATDQGWYALTAIPCAVGIGLAAALVHAVPKRRGAD